LTNVSNLGVGTTVVPTIKIRAIGDNNSSSRIAMRGYSSDANSSAIRVTKFRGTASAPQAPQSGDSLGKFELAGYGTTSSEGYPQASLEGVATEAWGAVARGTKAVIKVTPNTTTTQVTAVTINQDSTAVFANTVTANGVLLTGNTGTVTSVAATAGTGISISGSPITTSGTLTVTNTAPDQTVVLTAGTGISTTGTYPNFTITNTSPSSGGTVTSVTGTSPVVSSGGNTPAISMPAATSSVNGYLTSTDWTTFNGKQPAGTYVTSVAATSPVTSTGGTTPTIAMPAATTSVSGYLTSTDWNTFNNKGSGTVTSVTGTAPVVSSGGATPAISMAAATGSVNGYLTSTDWNTFNGKAPAVTYTTNYIPYGQGTTTPNQSSALQFSGSRLTVNGSALIGNGGVDEYLYFDSTTAYVGRKASTGDIWLNNAGSQNTILGIAGTQSMTLTGNGGLSFGASGTAYGTSGQVLTSAGNTSPTWTTPTNTIAPAFNAQSTINQTIPASTYSKITFNNALVNLGSCYDAVTNYRFTPTTAGYYYCTLKVQGSGYGSTNCAIYLVGNGGAQNAVTSTLQSGYGYFVYVDKLMYFNGSTDYVEAWWASGTLEIIAGGVYSQFNAFFVRA
jgi:hypothetical protein